MTLVRLCGRLLAFVDDDDDVWAQFDGGSVSIACRDCCIVRHRIASWLTPLLFPCSLPRLPCMADSLVY